jgi:hypothetical protein
LRLLKRNFNNGIALLNFIWRLCISANRWHFFPKEDASSAAGHGLRHHAARAGEEFDTIQSLQTMRQLVSGAVAVLSYDYKAKAAEGASLWPPCPKGGEKSDAAKVEAEMPFDERFWTSNSKESAPKGIRGFFTALPTYWTSGENNQPGKMSTVLLTQSTPVKNSEVGERDVVNG